MYPGWNARDNYRFGLKKKKRKRDKSDDPGKYDVTTKQSNFILFLLSLSIVSKVAFTFQRGSIKIL